MRPVKHKYIPPAPPDKPPDRPSPESHIESPSTNTMNEKPTPVNTELNTLNTDTDNDLSPISLIPMNSTTITNENTSNTLKQCDMENDMSTKQQLQPMIRKLLKLPCIINEWNNATVMIDSGAACNCISRSYITSNNIETLECEPYLVTLANKTTTTSNEICTLTVSICEEQEVNE